MAEEHVGALKEIVRDVSNDVRNLHQRIEQRRNELHSSTPKSAATLERIIDAARTLIRERGGTDFQMKDVADLCGMSKGSVYYYFRDRSDLVLEVFTRSVDTFIARTGQIVRDSANAYEALHNMGKEFAREMRSGGIVFLMVASELVQGGGKDLGSVEPEFSRIVSLAEQIITKAQEEAYVRPEVDTHLVAVNMIGSFFFSAVSAIARGDVDAGADETDALMELLMQGVGTDLARAQV